MVGLRQARGPLLPRGLAAARAAAFLALAGCGDGAGSGEPRVPSASSATFTPNATYQTGGTVTVTYDPAEPLEQFELTFFDFQFTEALETADARLYLGEGESRHPDAPLSGNLVGSVDEIPEAADGLPAVENRADGAQIITFPASAGFTVADFDSVIIYCHPFDITVSVAAF